MTGILWCVFFLLFSPKKIFVKGLKFKEAQYLEKKNPHTLQNEDCKSKPLELPHLSSQVVT